MARRLRPLIAHNVTRSGRDEGHSITFEYVNDHNERCPGGFQIGELSLDDLRTLSDDLLYYLDEGRFQE